MICSFLFAALFFFICSVLFFIFAAVSFFVCSASFLFAAFLVCLQRSFFVCSVSLICSVSFLFAAFLFYLQRFFFVCSVSFLFSAFLFCLQRVPCGPPYNTVLDVYFDMKVSRGRSTQVTSFSLLYLSLRPEHRPKSYSTFKRLSADWSSFKKVVISSAKAVNLP